MSGSGQVTRSHSHPFGGGTRDRPQRMTSANDDALADLRGKRDHDRILRVQLDV